MKLSDYSKEDLLAEIEKRENIEKENIENKPKVLPSLFQIAKNINCSVIPLLEEHIEDIASGKYHEDNDDEHYIFKEVMKACYGDNIFDWINKNI